jgi:hypothetical protein
MGDTPNGQQNGPMPGGWPGIERVLLLALLLVGQIASLLHR